jgi:hypothetical protein
MNRRSGFRVQGSGFRVQGSGFRVQGSGFRVQGSGFRVQGGNLAATSQVVGQRRTAGHSIGILGQRGKLGKFGGRMRPHTGGLLADLAGMRLL